MIIKIVILCITIFLSRILDVTLGTIRTIMTVRGKRVIAALIGFVEVVIWFLIVREALATEEKSIYVALAYAGGFATGTLIGGLIVKFFIPSNMIVQVITSKRDSSLLQAISDAGFSMTVADVYGREHTSEKYMLTLYIDGRYLKKLKQIIIERDEDAFISISEGLAAYNGRITPHEVNK
ncbi:MAG TPA: DUF2179 domain-containing protein [Erysipelotrichaceae bacterium]|nr:DUF2179 domain-containing protein [Erysipelotrichaceae bacterium]